MNNFVLHTENLEFGYKTVLTKPVSLNTKLNDIICVIGRNGVGKSALLNTLSGILPPLSGNIYFDGIELKKTKSYERPKFVSFVPSKPEFLMNLTVYEMAALGRYPYTNIFDIKTFSDKNIIEETLKEYDLDNLKTRPLWALSDGEKQRVMICRAVIQQTPLIILDEPTAFLDYIMRKKLLNDLKNLAINKNKCIIFSSHDIEISLKYCTKIWFFIDNFIETFSPDEFINSKIFKDFATFREL
ncbi:MAG TPA: ABC transporter ATP-binding protein [Bacteroidales bacterium]|nr:ABC transporter ATP-binding protein [Bacteroidales bacterium]